MAAQRSHPRRKRSYDTVVIGASAGGVQALGELLPALPARFAPALVVVLHMPPDSPGLLADLFASRCAVPVEMACDKQPLAPGRILFAPPGYHTLIEDDATIALSLDAPENFSRPSIDALFESAAWALRSRVLGVLLTGANADGAAGLAAIERAGGGAWVQDPASAMSDTMPRSALAAGVAPTVLPLRQIARRLAAMTAPAPRDHHVDGPAGTAPPDAAAAPEGRDENPAGRQAAGDEDEESPDVSSH